MNYNIINFSLLIINFIICVSVVSGLIIRRNGKNRKDNKNAVIYLSKFGYIDHAAVSSPKGGPMSKWTVGDALLEFQIYLTKFGYTDHSVINSPVRGLVPKLSMEDAIIEFQAFAGLNQTGILDERTLEMMKIPRCGVVDKVGYGSSVHRAKRHASQVMNKWNKLDLTYKIRSYPKRLRRYDVDREIERAFKVWSDVTDLTFKVGKTTEVDIDIRFELREHGDDGPFEGPGGVVAHAFLPFCGGDAHFDKSETWTIDSDKGINLFETAVHEFGHSLGLFHSDVRSAIMSPFYFYSGGIFSLHYDDIRAIQSLYGEKTVGDKTHSASKPKIRSKPTESDSILCRDGSIDAIVTMEDNKTYVFKGENFWVLSNEGIEKGYPKSISKEFPGLLPNIDAANTRSNGKTYFFKESMYWRFSGHTMDDTYPREISRGFKGIPNNIDASFVWSGNGKVYFFKGENYYKFDSKKRPVVSPEYPKSITLWDGLPFDIDDAFQYSDGLTYFFKNGYYWRFSDRKSQVDVADPPYPREAGPRWFGCPAEDSHNVTPVPDKKSNSSNEFEYDNYEEYYSFYD